MRIESRDDITGKIQLRFKASLASRQAFQTNLNHRRGYVEGADHLPEACHCMEPYFYHQNFLYPDA